ncbi:MAG: aldehyde dehydrogenase [Smithella sp. SDB]|nr:MAG: aldehyde dehydrogenase [Smithella sp. SDB]
MPESIPQTLGRLRDFFATGKTRDVDFRIAQLKKLKEGIRKYEPEIMASLYDDMHKPPFEAYASEIGILYTEIDHIIRHLHSWSRPRRVATPVIHFLSRSRIYHDPYGVVLIISPWNYPFQLTIAPLIGAIAAGNCVLIKPSEFSSSTSATIEKMMTELFASDYVAVFQGETEATKKLLEEKFDYIFFTGSTAVGRVIMSAAARHLTPVTLELGGKSPTIVDEDVDLNYGIKRIAWGKFFNAGQTCIAPDYVLVHRKIKDSFIEKIVGTLHSFYGENPMMSPDYARIINERHFNRLLQLMKSGWVIYGGNSQRKDLYIAPTIIDQVSPNDPVMQEEIFGPILPLVEYNDIEEAIAFVNQRPRPLALYCFSKNKKIQNRILRETSAGGGCINDTISHIGSQELPFGGIGESGMGAYHGKASFNTFTHQRGILFRSNLLDISLRYPPYRDRVSLLQLLFRFIR